MRLAPASLPPPRTPRPACQVAAFALAASLSAMPAVRAFAATAALAVALGFVLQVRAAERPSRCGLAWLSVRPSCSTRCWRCGTLRVGGPGALPPWRT
jgi:hypothetical protein